MAHCPSRQVYVGHMLFVIFHFKSLTSSFLVLVCHLSFSLGVSSSRSSSVFCSFVFYRFCAIATLSQVVFSGCSRLALNMLPASTSPVLLTTLQAPDAAGGVS